ncbi:MAG: hypothetical protein HRU41_12890 [Saprospiraceae bacterium]|nr:hypothetical protein [Saprospiraceae bacterium]
MEKLKEVYQNRQKNFQETAAALRAKYGKFSLVRLLVFMAGIALTIYLGSIAWYWAILFFLTFVAVFYQFMKWHQQISAAAQHHEELAKINGLELSALNHDFSHFDAGAKFLEMEHPYALDLDLFGEHSLFQYINRTSTEIGRQRLAQYLTEPSATELIEARQIAIQELADKIEWRQHFQAHGRETEDHPTHLQALLDWLQDPAFVKDNTWLKIALYVAPIWFTAALILWLFYWPWQYALLMLIPPALILQRTVQRVNDTHRRTAHAEVMLSNYARLIRQVEEGSFQAPLLKELQSTFLQAGNSASKIISRLSYLISQLNVRFNAFAILLNLGGLWDLHWVYRLEMWRAAQKEVLPRWFDSLQEFEVLSSLGNLVHNHPHWQFPTITDAREIEALGIGHPLIRRDQVITNDISMPIQGHIKLITGSNMAGKSTFLRTLGINLVLGLSGSPVCANRLQLPQLQVYTSMRTQDALHESTSSFYAELKRLKVIIEAVEAAAQGIAQERPIFFLLDEILKGTNSVDRHTGAKALIHQLIEYKGGGLIATHDLELGALEAKAEGAIENLRIEVEIQDGELHFDYKLKKGVSQSFNATLLMQQMGIRVKIRES